MLAHLISKPLIHFLAAFVLAGAVQAAEVKVMNSGGFTAAYKELAPGCEAPPATRSRTPGAPPPERRRPRSRAAPAGEPADALIMAAPALDHLIRQGKAGREAASILRARPSPWR